MNNLNISLHIDSLGRIQCEDNTSYLPLENSVYTVIEVLLDSVNNVLHKTTKTFDTNTCSNIISSLQNCNTPMEVESDGVYTYIKLIIEGQDVPEIERSLDININTFPPGSLCGMSTILVYKNLQRCLEYYQVKSLEEAVSGVGPVSCRKNSETTTIRDLLLCAVYLIEMYIQQEEYRRAHDIVKNMRCCGLNCGCTNTIQNVGCNCE